MKIPAVHGSPRKHGNTEDIISVFKSYLLNKGDGVTAIWRKKVFSLLEKKPS